uniref:CSON011764 protein n=1 Tax=Culicoides sonorensis TaxID=179676 RepID=A0A336M6I1_CULSO
MAKLINVYRSDEVYDVDVKKRQLPVRCGDIQMFMMDLGSKGLTFDKNRPSERDQEAFENKYKLLSREELRLSLQVTRQEFTQALSISVPCVGCRRSVERLLEQLMDTEYPTVYPIVIHSNGIISISAEKIKSPASVSSILFESDKLLNELLEHQPRNKKSSRCGLHSLDSFRSRPFSEMWRDVWLSMNKRCKEEISIIEADELNSTLENYLKKHKFCSECRTKVEKAYGLLVNEENHKKEQGYVASLYSGIKRCVSKKHIHLLIKNDYIDNLIKKAEPELNGSHFRHRERHAKTLEIAQEEVLTCVGMCIYEKLRRIHVCLREEENACQVLASVSVYALSRNFDMAVDNKRGISNLEILYEELSREEKLKEERKELKKLKKRQKRRNNKRRDSCENCGEIVSIEEKTSVNCKRDGNDDPCNCTDNEEEDDEVEIDTMNCCAINNSVNVKNTDNDKTCVTSYHSCNVDVQHSLDAGYSSETHHESSCSRLSSSEITPLSSINTSPEGSEVACSEGFCNHDLPYLNDNKASAEYIRNKCNLKCSLATPGQFTLSLAQMLDETHTSDDDDDNEGIPDELILEFKSRYATVKKEREELRQRLITNFNRLCATSYVKDH